MLWIIANIFVYGLEFVILGITLVTLIGWIFPETKETGFVETIFRIMDFENYEDEEEAL